MSSSLSYYIFFMHAIFTHTHNTWKRIRSLSWVTCVLFVQFFKCFFSISHLINWSYLFCFQRRTSRRIFLFWGVGWFGFPGFPYGRYWNFTPACGATTRAPNHRVKTIRWDVSLSRIGKDGLRTFKRSWRSPTVQARQVSWGQSDSDSLSH